MPPPAAKITNGIVYLENQLVPESRRAVYRLLKNADSLPPELEIRPEIQTIEQLLAITEDSAERRQARKRLNYLLAILESARNYLDKQRCEQGYYIPVEKHF